MATDLPVLDFFRRKIITAACSRLPLSPGRQFPVRYFAFATVAFGLLASIQRSAGAAETPGTAVELKRKGDTLEILIDGSQFAVYNFAKSQPKPFFWCPRPVGKEIVRI